MLRFLAPLLAFALAAGACRRETDPTAASLPSDQTLRGVPLGAPPGQGASPAAAIRNPFEGDPGAVQDGKTLFGAMNCVYCHGVGASGLMGPPLNGQGWRYGGTPAEIYNSIHDGRPQGMPAWGARLPPDQIWRLVAYIESLGGARPPATPQMPALGEPRPSATGPQTADQARADASHRALLGSQRRGR
jgi:cytochrome c oxidase cbb3-type subunit 3